MEQMKFALVILGILFLTLVIKFIIALVFVKRARELDFVTANSPSKVKDFLEGKSHATLKGLPIGDSVTNNARVSRYMEEKTRHLVKLAPNEAVKIALREYMAAIMATKESTTTLLTLENWDGIKIDVQELPLLFEAATKIDKVTSVLRSSLNKHNPGQGSGPGS